MSVQKLNMTKTNSYEGNVIDGGLIWGDGPEGISAALLDTAAYGRALTNIKLTVGKTYEAEYYMHNCTGTNVIMAICVKNMSTSQSGSVTVLKSAVVNAPKEIYKQGMMAAFEKNSQSHTLAVHPGTSAYTDQGCTSLVNSGSLTNSYISNARVRFKVNSGDNLYLKIVAVKYQSDWLKRAGWANVVNAADLEKADPLAKMIENGYIKYNEGASLTGLYANVARNVTAPNLEPFHLCLGDHEDTATGRRAIDKYNNGEFEDPTNTVAIRESCNQGNFGVVYAIYCSNANANYVTIKPAMDRCDNGSYTVKLNGVWQTVNATKTVPAKLKLIGGHSIWFALNGGNYGDIELQFTEN